MKRAYDNFVRRKKERQEILVRRSEEEIGNTFQDQDITSMLTDHQHDLCSRISKSIRIFCSNLVDFPFSRGFPL